MPAAWAWEMSSDRGGLPATGRSQDGQVSREDGFLVRGDPDRHVRVAHQHPEADVSVGVERGELFRSAQHIGAASGFVQAFGEPLERVLDLDTWRSGTDLQGMYERLELDSRIGEALAQEDRAAAAIRAELLPRLRDRSRPGAPPLGGMWPIKLDELEKIHRGTLFAGHVDACDSTVQVHESLALTIIATILEPPS